MPTRDDARPTVSARQALITGVAGQDGSYLAELLLEKGYAVAGALRRPDADLPNLAGIRSELELHRVDVTSVEDVSAVLARTRPDEVYHLAAPTFVPDAWADPAATLAAVAGGTANVMHALRQARSDARVWVASSSEIFGASAATPQSEATAYRPANPYGVAKLAALQLCVAMRRNFGMHVSCAITFNHESPRRPLRFLSRKVTRAAAAIKLGRERRVALGDLDVVRDWSYAGDVVTAAWSMLQQPEGDEYVLASGVGHTVRELVGVAFEQVGLDWREHVDVDPALVRAPEALARIGDPSKARSALGWHASVGFEEMIATMVAADLEALALRR